jgi:hypothetical protein
MTMKLNEAPFKSGFKVVEIEHTAGEEKSDPTQDRIKDICDEIKGILVEKNRKYGNSALEPVRVFSQSEPDEQIRVRLDDKISRLRSGQVDDDEDVILDLIGYLVLLLVYRRHNT